MLLGENGLAGGTWAGSSHVVAHGKRVVWHLDVDPPAATRIPIDADIEAIAGARAEDVSVALGRDGKLRVLRGAAIARTIEDAIAPRAASGAKTAQLSDDGRIALVVDRDGAGVFDLTTGASLGRVDGAGAMLAPSSAHVATARGVFETRGLARVSDLGSGWGAAWVGTRLVIHDETTVATFDTVTTKVGRVKTGCTHDGLAVAETVDVATRRVLVDCRDRIVFVAVDDLKRVEVRLPAKHRFKAGAGEEAGDGPSAPLPVPDGNSVLVTRGGELLVVDEKGARETTTMPALRLRPDVIRGPCRVGRGRSSPGQLCEEIASPDRRWSLVIGASGISVLEAGSGKEQVRWGELDSEAYVVATEVRSGGLDQIARVGDEPRALRIGPETTARVAPRPATAPCPGGLRFAGRFGERDVHLGVREACVCTKTCALLAGGDLFKDASEAGIMSLDVAGNETTARLVDFDGRRVGSGKVPGACTSARMLQGEKAASFLCGEAPVTSDDTNDAKGRFLVEVALPAFTIARRIPLSATPLPLDDLAGVGRRAAVVRESTGTALTSILDVVRRTDGSREARIFAWPFGAVILFADGKVELFGEASESAVGCLVGARLLPFARCAPQLQVRGRFTLD